MAKKYGVCRVDPQLAKLAKEVQMKTVPNEGNKGYKVKNGERSV